MKNTGENSALYIPVEAYLSYPSRQTITSNFAAQTKPKCVPQSLAFVYLSGPQSLAYFIIDCIAYQYSSHLWTIIIINNNLILMQVHVLTNIDIYFKYIVLQESFSEQQEFIFILIMSFQYCHITFKLVFQVEFKGLQIYSIFSFEFD
jgi:hypothetical protein